MGVSDGSIIIVGAGIFGLTAAIEPAEPSLPPASPGGSLPRIAPRTRDSMGRPDGSRRRFFDLQRQCEDLLHLTTFKADRVALHAARAFCRLDQVRESLDPGSITPQSGDLELFTRL